MFYGTKEGGGSASLWQRPKGDMLKMMWRQIFTWKEGISILIRPQNFLEEEFHFKNSEAYSNCKNAR